MVGRRAFAGFACAWITMASWGCASQDKAKLGSLEERNRQLTNQLNKANSDLEAAMRERDAFNARLANALRDADALRAQMVEKPDAQPAPPGWTAVPGGGMIAIEDDLLFAPGKAALRDEARRTLDKIVSTINGEYGSKDIMVFGHTDDRPIKKSGWADNWQLSTERSLAVVRYLREHGVEPNRLVAAGCGENRPRTPNTTEPNRTANRRVEIFAIEPQSKTGRGK